MSELEDKTSLEKVDREKQVAQAATVVEVNASGHVSLLRGRSFITLGANQSLFL